MDNKPATTQTPIGLTLPVLPIREGVLFPHTESVLTFGRKISLKGLEASAKTGKMIVLVTQRKAKTEKPTAKDLYQVGTLAIIERTIKTEGTVSALVRGLGRVRILSYLKTKPAMIAKIIKLDDISKKDDELKALASHLQKTFRKTVQMGKPVEFLNFMKLLGEVKAGELADQVASALNIKTSEKQYLLETTDVKKRLKKVISHISHEVKVLEIEKDVVHKTQAEFDKHMRENVLRERLRTIQKELGEIDDDSKTNSSYLDKLKSIKLGDEIKKKVKKEIKRLKQMSPNNPEAGYLKTWLDIVFELPWGKTKTTNINLDKATKILDKHHHGLEEIKDRILEYIAVLQLKQENNKKVKKQDSTLPTIICFVGPPGVGKTSLGRSIAQSLDRDFTKISLGGIRDEAEIRGHRRTYVGAMTGRIIKGILQAKSTNPVFMLDEIDKIGNDFRGDPSAALLEVLDPEQNKDFEDHYLDIPFDLSKVLFITTANTLATIPPALLDRLEIIRFSGYTPEEKFNIVKKHLLKKVLINNGLKKSDFEINDQAINTVIQNYTKEAGVRNLERTLNKIARKTAKKIIELRSKKTSIKQIDEINNKILKKLLGPIKWDTTLTEKTNQIGTATGLAWTAVGGDVLFIEVAITPGKGLIKLTGKLGDVMKESAQAALTYIKANAKKLGVNLNTLKKSDVHVHVPEGAIPKDGPSAGITITTAMVSAFTNTPIKKEVAMTGEITLRGNVLPIGGLKEKAIAAMRAGSKTIIIPQKNERDIEKFPESVKSAITFKPVKKIDEVLKIALAK